jgi:hypothetical protein
MMTSCPTWSGEVKAIHDDLFIVLHAVCCLLQGMLNVVLLCLGQINRSLHASELGETDICLCQVY